MVSATWTFTVEVSGLSVLHGMLSVSSPSSRPGICKAALMTEQELTDRVKTVLVDEFELERSALHADVSLYDDLGLDSLDSVDLVVALEKEFSFKIVRAVDEEKIRAVRSLLDVCHFVQYKVGNGAA